MRDLPELIILDVGHGNCALIRDTEAVTIIDCPPTTILLETLTQLNINSIDQILISHADLDHASGLPALLGEIVVHEVYINPDATKKNKAWREIRAALTLAEMKGTVVHTSLTSALSRKIRSGTVEIEILAPSSAVALGGAGGEDLEGRSLTSNAMSVVIRLIHDDSRVALLPGDVDDVGLDNLLRTQRNIEAQILVFPHHGGKARTISDKVFAQKLCELVKPSLVLFSMGRNRFDNPREHIMQGVVSTVPDAHIMCTQLSEKCAAELPTSKIAHFANLPAHGSRGSNTCCCGGSISIQINGKQTTYLPPLDLHRQFVMNRNNVPTPLCLRHLDRQV
ncbi:MAG TPA: MBL fold metallo-hydrolase [Ktedonobacteraceae bacterium]|nr:MBL fold metallo-hydrolase [Ktedonobacteraceae bacterium]